MRNPVTYSLIDQLDLLPENIRQAFMQCGRSAIYPAGEWFPDSASGAARVCLIEDGEVAIYARSGEETIPLCRSGKGEFIGVRSMFSPESLPVIVWRTESEVTCIEFDQRQVMQLLQDSSGFELRTILERAARERDYDVLMTLHPLFRTLPRDDRRRLLADAHSIALLPGETLLRDRIENDTLYLISRGSVEVFKEGKMVARKGAGTLIGEISVLRRSDTATADVVSGGWCELLAFPGEMIRQYCRAHAGFEQELDRLQTDR